MYDLPHHKGKNQEEIIQFMKDHPFVFLTGSDAANKPVATQIPVFMDEKDGKYFLTGHIMRNTDHHKAFEQNKNVLAVFTGPHIYVSAAWYANPSVGSTWNYMSVHAKGTIRFGDTDELVAILKRLSLYFENNNPASATVFDNLPAEYTQRMIKAIVPFEIEINDLQHVFKLSQDRDEKSYENIIDQLEKRGEDGQYIAERMRQNKTKVFGEK